MNPRSLTRIGPYEVRRFIAEGGMAWVFEVADPRFEGREVIRALKMLKPEAAVGDEFERFKAEAGLLAGFDHPNLVVIFDFGRDEDTDCFYYTMTYVDGPNLAERLRERGPCDAQEAVRIIAQVLGGLAELHDREIIHRDIKPGNVLISSTGRVRLSDLGIARVQQDRALTRTGMAVGTVLYMSPEQARCQPVEAQSDVFSVGLTLYEALTGKTVYASVEGVDSTSNHEVLGYLVALSRTGEEIEVGYPPESAVPRGIEHVIAKACRYAPEERYRDARQMLAALERSLPRDEPQPQARRWPWVAAVGSLIAAAALAGGYAWWSESQFERKVEEALQLAAALQEPAHDALERAKDLDPPPDRELIARAERSFDLAANDLDQGRRAVAKERFEAAESNLLDARELFAGVCQQLAEGDLSARAEARVRTAREKSGVVGEHVEDLRKAGAEDAVFADWSQLQAQMGKLAAPGPATAACPMARAHLTRLEGAEGAIARAERIDSTVTAAWPRRVEAARAKAATSQSRAEAERVEVPDYGKTLEAGRSALADGERLRDLGELRAAHGRYQNATRLFQEAAAVVPAAKGKAEVRRLEGVLEKDGIPPTLKASVLVSEADQLYGARRWTDAADAYAKAANAMIVSLEEGVVEKEAGLARKDARESRRMALEQGAVASAQKLLAQGDSERFAADAAFDERRYDEATRQFRLAEKTYLQAREAAFGLLAEAGQMERRAREVRERVLPGGDCESFESQQARGSCRTGLQAMRRGEDALEAKDALSALEGYRLALASLESAHAAEAEWLAGKPWPPELASRTPRRETVEIYRGRTQAFAIEATDRNKDPLRYTWAYAGQDLDQIGAKLALRPERSGRLEVTVSDGRDAFTESWQIEMVDNRAPSLAVTPSGQTVNLRVGGKKTFKATASDPDGDAVATRFQLDGWTVGTQNTYVFSATKPGDFELEINATDARGAASAQTRKIRVTKAHDTVTRYDGVYKALDRFESALNSRSMEDLEDVFPTINKSPYGQIYPQKWRSDPKLEFSIAKISKPKQGKQGVTVDFVLTESSPQRKPRPRTYVALLLKRKTTGEWQIYRYNRKPD